MVSVGTIESHSSEFTQVKSNYSNQIENTDSIWKGSSHDSLVNQSSSFSSEMDQVLSQFSSFKEAVSLYESYKETKNTRTSYASVISSCNDQATINQYNSIISDCDTKMNSYATQIQDLLSKASSYKLQATTLSGTASGSGSVEITSEGGKFVSDSRTGMYGYMISSIDGKKHYIYKQSQISGWSGDCNRAAASSIASAYSSSDWGAVNVAKQSANGIGYKSEVTKQYFANFGLYANVNNVNTSYDNIKSNIVSTLSQGNYVMFDLSQSNVVGKSGQKWSSVRHWVSVLDIKKTGSGDNDYAIFVSDSGHGGSTVDHGLGTGWYSINEFSGKQVANFTTVRKA